MKFKILAVVLIFGLLMTALVGCGGGQKQAASDSGEQAKPEDNKPVFISLAGGPAAGSYGKAAAGISVVVKEKSGGKFSLTPQSSSGGGENITLVGTGQTQMGLAAAADMHDAFYGEGAWEGKKEDRFRLIGLATLGVVNIATMENSGIKTIQDLNGKKVSFGSPGSASTGFMDRFATHIGLNFAQKLYLPGGDAATAMKDGQIDAYNWAPSFPAPDLVDLASTSKVRLLDVGTIAKDSGFLDKYPYYTPFIVKAGTYNGIDYDVPTIKTGIFWIVNRDMPEEQVYEITKMAYQNTEALATAFGPLKVMTPDASALEGADVPLHPGAEKFWKEIGVQIPDSVKAQ